MDHRRVYLEEIAKCMAQGMDPAHIPGKTNLDPAFVRSCMVDPEFDLLLEKMSPEAYELWQQSKESDIARGRVKTQANEDAPAYYKELKDITMDPDSNLLPREKSSNLVHLINMSDAVKKETAVEHVVLSPTQLNNVLEALRENREAKERVARSYN